MGQLALRMSMTDTTANDMNNQENELMVAAKEASLREYNGISTPTTPDPKDNKGHNVPTATTVAIPDKKNSTTASTISAASRDKEGGQQHIDTPEPIHANDEKNNHEESDRILAFQLRDSQNIEDASLAMVHELQGGGRTMVNQEEADRILAFQLRESQNEED